MMKKLVLITLLPLTISVAGSFVMQKGSPLLKTDSDTVNQVTTGTNSASGTTASSASIPDSDWTETPLPTQKFNVLYYGLKGDGSTDDTDALKALAQNTAVTNWYFPAGHRFRLHKVNIPSHVNAVFGEGTIVSISTGETGLQYGALYTRSTHKDLVIDGLTFVGEEGYKGDQFYGMLQFDSDVEGAGTDNTQIRNCTFDASLRRADSLRVFGRSDPLGSDHTNMRIYNNKFINSQYFAIEAFNTTDEHSSAFKDDMEGLNGLRIYANEFSGDSSWGVGIGRIRGGSYIYNNTMDINTFGVEIIQSNNNHTFNNHIKARKDFLNEGTADALGGGHYLTPGVNYIHHNHFEGLQMLLYYGSKSEVYENYIGGRLFIEARDGDRYFGNVHHNTIVTDDPEPVKIEDMDSSKGGILANNEIYSLTDFTGIYCITYHNATPKNVQVTENVCHQKTSPNYAVKPGFIESGTVYSTGGTVPVSRTDAGTLF